MSFASVGVTSLGEYQANFQFLSETKAYFFDGATAQIVIWNPEEMTVTGRIPLDAVAFPDTVVAFSGLSVSRACSPSWRCGPPLLSPPARASPGSLARKG